jgi:hypothetical protein
MRFVWGWAAWLAGDAGAAGAGPNSARVVANVVIVVASVYVARLLYRFCRRWPGELLVSRVVAVFAVLVALCGAAHLALLLNGRAALSVVPTVLKVLAAGLWVVVAVKLPALVSRLSVPVGAAGAGAPGRPGGPAPAAVGPAPNATQPGAPARAEARPEARGGVETRGAEPCQI